MAHKGQIVQGFNSFEKKLRLASLSALYTFVEQLVRLRIAVSDWPVGVALDAAWEIGKLTKYAKKLGVSLAGAT
eukprot:2210898-Amphidinium_carterae.1